MKLTIGEDTFTSLKDLKFDPTADITGSEVPINEFSVDVETEKDIDAMQYSWLYDDNDNLWAKYWVVYADREDEYFVSIKAQSSLKLLERRMLDADMYSSRPVAAIMEDIFYELGPDSYTLDSTFAGNTLTGYVPDQSAKTRLQWVCFMIGAYIKSFFSEKIEIRPVPTTAKLIPLSATKWRPSLRYSEYKTRLHVTTYAFRQGTPSTTDAHVEANGVTYIRTQLNHSIGNPDIITGTLVNDIYIEGITLVSASNVDEILSRLAPLYFRRLTVSLEAINNAEYLPGDNVIVYTDEGHLISGYIKKATFVFGLQATAKLDITPGVEVEGAQLTVVFKYGQYTISKADYFFPIGYPIEIENPWFDEEWLGTRYILKPDDETITVTLADDTIVEQQYTSVLEYRDGTLNIISVDDITSTEGVAHVS